MLKGQVLSIDYIVSAIVFLAATSFFIYFISIYDEDNKIEQSKTYFFNKANEVKDAFIYYPGIPYYWNLSYVIKYGFANERNVLNKTKLYYLQHIPYENFKNAFNIIGDVFVNISYVNGTPYLLYGLQPPSTSSIIVKSKGYGLIDKSVVAVEVQVWL